MILSASSWAGEFLTSYASREIIGNMWAKRKFFPPMYSDI